MARIIFGFTVTVLSVFGWCGCESQKPAMVKLYPGPARPLQELAIISVREPDPGHPEGKESPLWLRRVDDTKCYAGTVEVTPGDHVFFLIYTKWIHTKEGLVRLRDRSYLKLPMTTQANHIYLLHGRIADEKTLYFYPIDVTGKVTLTPEGTILFSKEFETHWIDYVKVADDYKERSAFRR